jgi:hypothetical protein
MNVCFRREPITHRPKPTGRLLKLPRGFAPEREALPDTLQPIVTASSHDLVIKYSNFYFVRLLSNLTTDVWRVVALDASGDDDVEYFALGRDNPRRAHWAGQHRRVRTDMAVQRNPQEYR